MADRARADRGGDVGQAAEMLTRPYRIRGMVIHGDGRGTKIGFPTANIDAIDTILPGFGVYAGVAHLANEQWPAAINIGPNPTFGDDRFKGRSCVCGVSGRRRCRASNVPSDGQDGCGASVFDLD